MAVVWEHDDAVRAQTVRTRIVKVDDEKSQQRVDLKARKNEKPKKIWRPQDFGYSSVPPEDTDGVILQMGGRADRSLYFDGGHEKYRPKKTPEGCAVLFNMYGDIIRQFKDSQDHVHQKKINIRIGKGYDAGNSAAPEGDTDDKSSEDTKTISMVLEDGESIQLEYDGVKVTLFADGWVECEGTSGFAGGVGGMWINSDGNRINLGVATARGTATPAVQTTAGPSSKVFAEV